MFSTQGMREASVDHGAYHYYYQGYGNECDLDYTVDGGATWTTFATWDTYGTPSLHSIDLPAGALGEPNVQLRWHRTT